jgi:hypothetical protein
MKFLVVFFFLIEVLFSQTNKISVKDLFSMEESKSYQVIAKLNKEQTAELITQIRAEYRNEFKELDKFYLLISHLESIKAIEEEQARLKSLNLVYVLGLILLLSFLFYIILSQRKAIKQLEILSK